MPRTGSGGHWMCHGEWLSTRAHCPKCGMHGPLAYAIGSRLAQRENRNNPDGLSSEATRKGPIAQGKLLPLLASLLALTLASCAAAPPPVVSPSAGRLVAPQWERPAVRQSYSATVMRWIDGDTVELHVEVGLGTYRTITIRCVGVDTPELRAPTEEQRVQARAAKARAVELAPTDSRGVVLLYRGRSFTRYLGNFWPGNEPRCVAEVLVEEKLGRPTR